MQTAKYEFVTFEQLKERLDPSQPVAFDTETIGLYGKIRLAQFYQPHFEDVCLMIENPDPYLLVSLLSHITIICHNAHYDVSTIQENLGRQAWMPDNIHCTFLLARLHFYNEMEFSFDKVVQYALGVNPYEGDKKDLQGSDWSVPVLTPEQLSYAASDVIYLYSVWNVVNVKVDDISYKLDILTLRYCLDFQNNGLPFDEEKLNDRYARNSTRIAELALPINCNSYQQVRQYIGSVMSDDHGLSVLSYQGNERAKAVRETRKLTKNNSFLTKFLNTASDGCIFGKFKPSARSGRTTSDDQNLQQLPRSLKEIFGVEEDGDTVLIYSDFAACQLRCVCAVTGDAAMEALLRQGADLHNYVAEIIFGAGFTPQQRQICKTANFGLLFGAGVATFQKILIKEAGLWLEEAEIAKLKKKWLSLWKQIAEWQNRGIADWKKGKAWETPLGRRYKAKMMTDQLAMQIQGYESEVTRLAMHYMLPKLASQYPEVKLRNFIHDSYIFTCPNDPEMYKAVSLIIGACMKEAWYEMSKSVKVKDLPMPTTVRVGWNWGAIEKGKFIHEVVQ